MESTNSNLESTTENVNALRKEIKQISQIIALSTNVPIWQIIPIVEDALAGTDYGAYNDSNDENIDDDSANEDDAPVDANEEAVTESKPIRFLRRNTGPRYAHYRVRSFVRKFPKYTRI